MKLREIVVEQAILPELEATGRDEAVAELVNALHSADAIEAGHVKDYVKAIIKRENRGSTGFGRGVAVPHIKDARIDKLYVAIGISPSGIDFNSLDRQPVHSIFLLLSPEDKPEEHLDAMEAIFTNLQQDTFRRFLQQARDVNDVLTLLDEADAEATTG